MSLLMSEDSEAGLKGSGWVVATLLCQGIPDHTLLRRLSLNLPFLTLWDLSLSLKYQNVSLKAFVALIWLYAFQCHIHQ